MYSARFARDSLQLTGQKLCQRERERDRAWRAQMKNAPPGKRKNLLLASLKAETDGRKQESVCVCVCVESLTWSACRVVYVLE